MKKLFTSESVSEGHPDIDYSQERWKPVEAYGGIYKNRYEVSDFGRVRSLDMEVLRGTISGRKYKYIQKGKFLTHTLIHGYPTFTLTDGHTKQTAQIHRLVAFAFVDGYKDGLEINHKDENRKNNHYTNLEWVTRKENINHGYHNFRQSVTKGKPVYQLSLDGKTIRGYISLAQASRETGILRENISKCCNNIKGWKTAGGYKWKFMDY